MGTNDTRSGSANQGRHGNDAPGVGKTRMLIDRVIHSGISGRTTLFDHIERTNGDRQFDPSELVELSVKLSLRGFSQNQYCAPLTWTPRERATLAEHVRHAAPTKALRDILTPPGPSDVDQDKRESLSAEERAQDEARGALREIIGRTARYFSCVVHDFDARSYGVLFFKPRPTRDQESIDLTRRAEDLQTLADIRGVEIDMDDPSRKTIPVYFRVKLPRKNGESPPHPLDILEKDYTPHPWLVPRVLEQVPNRNEIVEPLRRMLADVGLVREPVVKLVPPPSGSHAYTIDDWRDARYDVHVCVLDEAHPVFLEAHRASMLALGRAFGCDNAVSSWLDAVDPFDCFMSRLEVGPDSVVIHYRSTPFHKRKQVAHRMRGKKAADKKGG